MKDSLEFENQEVFVTSLWLTLHILWEGNTFLDSLNVHRDLFGIFGIPEMCSKSLSVET